MQAHFRSLSSHGLAVALVVAVPVLLEMVFNSLLDSVKQGGQFPWWLPTFETVGKTAVVYLWSIDLLIYVVVPIIVFVLGYHYAKVTLQ